MKKGILLVVLAMLCVALLAACGNGDTPEPPEPATPPSPAELIIGTWECHDTSQPHQWMCSLVFTADGRFTDGDGDDGDFVIDGDTLTFEFDLFHPIIVNFTVTEDE